MPARIRDKGIRVMVKPNSLVGPFGEGTVLSQQYLEEVYHADMDHILRNGGVVEVSQDTPLTPIAGADLAPLIDRPHAVVGGAFNPVLQTPQEEPPSGDLPAGAEGVDLGGDDDEDDGEEAPATGTTNVTAPEPNPEEPAHRPVNTRGGRGSDKAK